MPGTRVRRHPVWRAKLDFTNSLWGRQRVYPVQTVPTRGILARTQGLHVNAVQDATDWQGVWRVGMLGLWPWIWVPALIFGITVDLP